MATGLAKILADLQQSDRGLTDGQLLARFVAAHDEASFAALVRRHGPMVLGVCRRVLHDFHDAEDAFQATFLVLARKASSVLKRESVGCWLYGTAFRTALEARVLGARQRARERPMRDMPHPEVPPAEAQDWRPLLDRELSLLPRKHQAAIVLCDLEGRSRREAARQLGVSEGTLSSRLARGRALLAKRLTRCGVVLSGGALAAALGQGAASAQVSTALTSATARAAARVVAGQVAAVSTTAAILMREVMKAMLMTKLRLAVGGLVLVAALGVVGLAFQAGGESGTARAAPPDRPRSELEALRHENELLKLNLEVVLEKVRAQEAELRELRAPRGDGGRPGMGGMGGPAGMSGMPGMPGGGAGPGGPMGPMGRGQGMAGPGGIPMGRGSGGMMGPGRGRGTAPGVGGPGPATGGTPPGSGPGGMGMGPTQPGGGQVGRSPDPVQEAEAALKALRQAKDPDGQREAADRLEKALERLKRQRSPADPNRPEE